ncbi:phosphatidylserine decarboxylase [Brevibacillus laterosporus]|uniref:Phosphatidylserine decarboxylase proenzyme n=1 Tax=Brevibacillus laterosporus TaxID=1465 RepID=A0A518V5Z8_BRELA|nr:archaetidylserine decarboxylase [Brevibacillus laterosporus]QDX92431.1 phosphatidylserine decarboxylase [Brevibacillus laterosporus]RAP26694.1 Phosphatidylserine decarboxylase [Brevibacillus laterosporus]TPG70742.1 phosphatidylserine decarboxylase [Brevibacillus laterosporus]
MKKRVFQGLINKLPQNVMSRQMGKVASSRFSRFAIQKYINHYQIDVSEIEKPVREYRSLKEFFTRRLKSEARPVDLNAEVVSPVDGKVSQMGGIQQGTLIQAKGKTYTVSQLLGDDEHMAGRFYGGSFMTIYLSPRDYHRIHMPVEGKLFKYSYLPGKLYPVNDMGVEHVEKLFARNERLITYVQSKACGNVAVVKVGALFVGSVKVTYNAQTTNVKNGKQVCEVIGGTPFFEKGRELGWFEFGSTVILLFEKGEMNWAEGIKEGSVVKMGQKIAVSTVPVE